ncbi:MAG: bifunctional sugar-1-phosphate nucleotidylyltransferase/acetyltransferase [Candidatus Bathyarchaeia archaeon]
MKAVVLAAGRGERLHPLTLTSPKPLLPIGGVPVIEHLLRSLRGAGIDEVLLIVRFKAREIRDHLGEKRFGVSLSYRLQEDVLGTAHAAGSASEYVGDEPFLLVYGDLYLRATVLESVLARHRRTGSMCMAVTPSGEPGSFGVVTLRDQRVTRIEEKKSSKPGDLVNAGVYVLDSRIFEYIGKTKRSVREEYELTDSIQGLIDGGGEILGVLIGKSDWIDIGRPWDLLLANEMALEARDMEAEGDVSERSTLVGPIGIGEGARVMAGTYIEGPVCIGGGSSIGPNCYIRPHTSIGERVRVGNGCEVKNSIIMSGTHIAHLSYVGDSVIGRNCNIGGGTIVANVRFDGEPVKMTIGGKVVSTGRRKFGAVIGDGVQTGVNASLMPGVKIGPSSRIGPGVIVYKDVPPNSVVLQRAKTERREVPRR